MKKTNLQKLLERVEGEDLISDTFHAATRTQNLNTSHSGTVPKSWTTINFKTYPRLDKVIFNGEKMHKSELIKILRKRTSSRNFSGAPILKKELYSLLNASCGLSTRGENLDYSRRPYPSAGARYPLEIYPLVLNCTGIEEGLYHYNVKENLLEQLLKEDLSEWSTRVTGEEKWIKNVGVLFIITGVLDRTRIKYGDRGYRYSLIEAGHLGQNICLLATELNLGCCPMGGYIDEEVNKLLDIDLQKEFALYVIALGKV